MIKYHLPQVLRIHGNMSKSFFHWKVRFLLGAAIGGLFGIAYLVSKKVKIALKRVHDQAVNDPRVHRAASDVCQLFST